MSVKTMSTEQLQNDLKSVTQMWPGGIPTEQADRVNALNSELKRRNVTVEATKPLPSENIRASDAMSDDELARELRQLSEQLGRNPKDDEAQKRFADIRFEIRQRSKFNNETPDVRALLTARTHVKVAAFDPVTGQTDMETAANGEVENDELEIQRKFSFIHALTKHLLRVSASSEIFIGVMPLNNGWKVQVNYAGFLLSQQAEKLSDALDMVLEGLTGSVSMHLEEGMRLLSKSDQEAIG
jgi:hypothetical protein